MTFYIYSPNWFSGIDSFLEIITVLISLIIGGFSYKIYRYFEKNNYKYFSLAFFLLGFSFLFKIISNLMLIVPRKRIITSDFYTIAYTSYQNYTVIDDISFLLHKIFLILGLLIFYFVITKEKKKENILFLSLFGILIGYLAESYIIFNFVVLILITFLFLINLSKDKLKKNKNISKLTLFFGSFMIGYVFLILGIFHENFDVLGECFLFISFIFLIYELFIILKK